MLIATLIIAMLSLITTLYLLYNLRQASAQTQSLARRIEANEASERERLLIEGSETAKRSYEIRESIGSMLQTFGQSVEHRLSANDAAMERISATLDSKLTQNEQRMERVRSLLGEGLDNMRVSNERKLEEMRVTVGEKLDATLDKRLDASFRMVSERLEQVYKGLGEMNTLSRGVEDLQRVLTNVKTRGIWGEMQLNTMLEQTLSQGQYETNAKIKQGSQERVEFAVKMPGATEGKPLLLPIDSKFPLEAYRRLLEASEQGDAAAQNSALSELENTLKNEAKRISSKYIDPPTTTDFAILFLPVEALYAEISRLPHTVEKLQADYRVIIAGPTTLFALLNSLRIGFRTLAIEKRSHEVWKLLGAVKTDFSKYADLLDTTRTKIEQAGKSIDEAARRTRTIERRLEDVQVLDANPQALLDEAG